MTQETVMSDEEIMEQFSSLVEFYGLDVVRALANNESRTLQLLGKIQLPKILMEIFGEDTNVCS